MKRLLVFFIAFALLIASLILTPTPTHAQGCNVTFSFTYPTIRSLLRW
jgi:hypothetical protein